MDIQYLEREGQAKLAYVYSPANASGAGLPTVMFCGGYKSDMMGTKASYFEKQCQSRGQAYLRFDYSGHGMSEGEFCNGVIGAWFADALDIFDALINGPVIVIGSSMGGWIALLLAQARAKYIKGLIGVAAAPDFTLRLYEKEFNDEQRKIIDAKGNLEIPNEYSDEPYIFTPALFDDGKKNLVLDRDRTHDYPIALFHGLKDVTVARDVPLAIEARYSGGPFDITFIDDGDHSLSRPQDLQMIEAEIVAMSKPQIL